MKKFVIGAINVVACLMLILGAIMFFVCVAKGDEAGRGYFTRDPAAQTMWYIGTIPSIVTFLSSFIVFGFAYIVEAACKYLEKPDEQETPDTEE